MRNKFDSLGNIINNNIDILIISETKLDPSFPTGQFHIHGFSEPFRFDISVHLWRYTEVILSKMTVEGFYVEINLRKKGGSFAAHITQKNLSIRKFEQNWQKSWSIVI